MSIFLLLALGTQTVPGLGLNHVVVARIETRGKMPRVSSGERSVRYVREQRQKWHLFGTSQAFQRNKLSETSGYKPDLARRLAVFGNDVSVDFFSLKSPVAKGAPTGKLWRERYLLPGMLVQGMAFVYESKRGLLPNQTFLFPQPISETGPLVTRVNVPKKQVDLLFSEYQTLQKPAGRTMRLTAWRLTTKGLHALKANDASNPFRGIVGVAIPRDIPAWDGRGADPVAYDFAGGRFAYSDRKSPTIWVYDAKSKKRTKLTLQRAGNQIAPFFAAGRLAVSVGDRKSGSSELAWARLYAENRARNGFEDVGPFQVQAEDPIAPTRFLVLRDGKGPGTWVRFK